MVRPTRARRGERKGMADLPLTPLIDTALTLLVIFMITAPMMHNSINIRLPKGEVKEVADNQQRMFIQVTRQGELFFEAHPISSRNDLLDLIKREASRSGLTMVVVEADEGIAYGFVYGLIDDIKKLGVIDNVAMSSRNR